MEKCVVCQSKKSSLACGLCHDLVCKNCAEFTSDETFYYSDDKPKNIPSAAYCPGCFGRSVTPAVDQYESVLAQARDIRIFDKSQSKETRNIKRLEEILKVDGCSDEHDVNMKLAFMAARRGFNSIIDVEIKSAKIRNGSYQTSTWSGTCIPAQVSNDKLVKDRSIRDNPN